MEPAEKENHWDIYEAITDTTGRKIIALLIERQHGNIKHVEIDY